MNTWMPVPRLRYLARAGLTYDEIAEINYQETGYKPAPGVLSVKLRDIGMQQRVSSRRLPWVLASEEHRKSAIYRVAMAELRRREAVDNIQAEGAEPAVSDIYARLSKSDQGELARLRKMVLNPELVICYNPDHGFYLVPKSDDDDDIFRGLRPSPTNRKMAPGEESGGLNLSPDHRQS